MNAELQAHLETGLTTVAHAWAIERKDGVILGFTDHDRDLSFDGATYRADTGLSALSLAQSTGLVSGQYRGAWRVERFVDP